MSKDDHQATYDDLLALPEGHPAEIIAGEVVTLPSGRPQHSRSQCWLSGKIGGPFDHDDGQGGPGGWWIFPELDVRFGPHEVVRPDLVGWRRERLPHPHDLRPIDVVPDWTCEILSPSNARHDRVTKREIYARNGVPHYWIVDPEAETLEVLELRDDTWSCLGCFGTSDRVRLPPFHEVELDLSGLFLPRRD
ncbi:MAG: Uma2 family endonuclease [Acidobacteriota bacterium]